MKLLLLCLIFCIPSDCECSFKPIIGGYNSDISEIPYIVSIIRNDTPICGGAILSEIFVATAAHCFQDFGFFSVRAGSNYPDNGGKLIIVKKYILHPEYKNNDYDFAVVVLGKALKFSMHIQPIHLGHANLPDGTLGRISGYGETYYAHVSEDTDFTLRLRSLEVPVLNYENCVESYKDFYLNVHSNMFCAGFMEGDKDSCFGDSGGPFVINKTLYGIISWGNGCALPDYPGVYANVSLAYDWFQEQMQTEIAVSS